jgi:AcrR family transcriptional regulator
MTDERVAEYQAARIEAAMVEAVDRDGYAGTTIAQLVGLAGVSKTTFYEHFDSKLACFLATFDEIIRQVGDRVSDAYRAPGDFRTRLLAALRRFMELVVEEPAAARLTAVESLALGRAGVAHREGGSASFEVLIRQSFDHSPSKVEVPDVLVRAIVAGIRGVVYRRLRAGRAEELPGLAELLVDWALSFQRRPTKPMRRAIEAASRPRPTEGPADRDENTGATLSWQEPADSDRSRAVLSQQERMIRGAAQVVVANGYESLSIPTISAAAGVSNQTFYEHFAGKRDTFLAAFESIAAEVLLVAGGAFAAEDGEPEAIGAGLRAMLEYFAAHELFAQLAFFELPTAGPAALDRADRALDDFTAFLRPGVAPAALGGPVAEELLPAISSAIWATIQHEIVHGERRSLPALAPDLACIAVSPFYLD